MSYCRFLEGDVYVFMHVGGHLECCACFLGEMDPWGSFQAKSTQEMVDHLEKHKAAGHYVPERVFSDLWADDKENFPREDNN
jgi:hypothetical protein